MKPLVELVQEWSAFEEKMTGASVEKFCHYYLEKQKTKTSDATPQLQRIHNAGMLIKVMGRILAAYSMYLKAGMNQAGIPSAESFYYLNGLSHLGEVRKSDLINYLFAETTTGMEAINKLVREKKISERTSEDDKRAKLIRLTPAGKKTLEEFYPISTSVIEMIFKGIADDTLVDSYNMLKYCEQQNSAVAIELKGKPFDKMYEQVMGDGK